jgi:hypothetical protein
MLTEQRIALGGRWQIAEGLSPVLAGELRGPVGSVLGAVTASLDAPIGLSDRLDRRTWTSSAGVAALWPVGKVELGMDVGVEHQRWWQETVLVESAWRPQIGFRGGMCPVDGPVCLTGQAGWSLRRVSERSGASVPTVATPLHISLQVQLRRVQ